MDPEGTTLSGTDTTAQTAAASQAGSTGVSTPVASPTSAAPDSGSSTSTSTATTVGGGATSQPAQQDYATVRDTLRTYGLDLTNQFQDDHQALQYLVGVHRQTQQLQQLAQYGQTYLQHADRFQAYLREQQDAQQRQQAQQQAWWKAPDYDPSWASKLTRDPATGEVRAVPGADPTLVQKYLAWSEHQRGFLDRFAQDPIKAIQPGIEQIAAQVAQQMIQQHLGGYQQQTQAQSLVQANTAWIHAQDAQGNPVRDPHSGRPMLSEWGRRYAGYVQQAEQYGLRNVQAQHDYAMGLVQRDYLAARVAGQGQQQQAQAVNDQAKEQFLQNAGAGVRNPGGAGNQAVGPNGAPANPANIGSTRGLAELMLKNMQANGFQAGQELDLSRR